MHLTMILAAWDWLGCWFAKTQPGVGANAIHMRYCYFVSSAATDNDGVSSAVHGTAGTNDRAAGGSATCLLSF